MQRKLSVDVGVLYTQDRMRRTAIFVLFIYFSLPSSLTFLTVERIFLSVTGLVQQPLDKELHSAGT